MRKVGYSYLLIILVCFSVVLIAGTLCQAAIPDAPNISRTIPVDLFGREKVNLDKYRDMYGKKTDQVPTLNRPSPSPTTIITVLPTDSGAPSSTYPTTIALEPQMPEVPGSTESEPPGILETLSGNLFISALLIFTLEGGGTLITLGFLSRDIRRPGGEIPWWHAVRRVFLGAHTFMAALFFMEAVLFVVSVLLWNGLSVLVLAEIILTGFLLAYGAASSAGMAYLSHAGTAMKTTTLGHMVLTGAGAVVSLLPWGSVLPFSPLIIAATFIISLCIVAAQVWTPKAQARRRAVTFPDTLLFESKPTPYAPPFPPELGQRYSDGKFIHQGGIARVFLARRREDGVEVAVKVPIKTDEQTGKSLLREMGVWRTLVHPGIVQVHSANILPIPYVEMEYMPRNLAEIPVPMEPCDAARMIRKIALALAFAHERGVIHRDLKPGNILISPDGEPKIGDWGLSRDDNSPNEPSLHGFSLSYAAPEQLDPSRYGSTTGKTDIYQMGIIFYQLITGVLPFPGESIAEITRERLGGTIKVPSLIVPSAGGFDAIIQRCLTTDPSGRYDSVRDFITDLDTCMREQCRDTGE